MFRTCLTVSKPRSGSGRFVLQVRRIAAQTAIDDEQQAAKAWFATYTIDKVPRERCTVTYSRSSGPGGQNVNKTSSKAMLRLLLSDLVPSPPKLILDELANSRFATDKGRALVFHADTSRKQVNNKDECFDKLDELIVACCSNVIKKETSPEQLKKIEKL